MRFRVGTIGLLLPTLCQIEQSLLQTKRNKNQIFTRLAADCANDDGPTQLYREIKANRTKNDSKKGIDLGKRLEKENEVR